ncbi:Protein of unknown function DUF1645 [Macleaya cordata]|uniref:Calmodulin-binding protein n=1 Tax=Macleaya cordata TaxID=56857 RepID=A0A200PNN3_MACCD|nr:Protein of unknown function DUF1645 [Macleaya cordata]
MEVVTPVPPPLDFHHDSSSCSTPYISAPSSPKLFSHELYFSAPTSPTRISAIYQDFNNNNSSRRINGSSSSVIPFDWEEKPGKPKSPRDTHDEEDDFAFDFSGQFEKSSLSAADELFDGGKIRALKPPPRLLLGQQGIFDDSSARNSLVSSPRSPRSPIAQGKKIIREAFSPRQRNKDDVDPFAVAIEQTRKEPEPERGRDLKVSDSSSKKSGHRWTRSLSPFRVSEFEHQQQEQQEINSTKPNSSNLKPAWFFRGYRKWKLKDLLLFRSASEGRATDEKDTLRKFAVLSNRKNDDVKSASFRSTDSTGSASSSRRRGPVSPHELHYTVNRAVSEELRKKTFLPYKQGLLGCLGFNPTAHGLAKGLNL